MSSTRSDFRLAAVSNICQAITVNAAVILVGHGSPRVSRPAADLNRIALALRQREGFAAVEVAMLNGSGGRPADVFARVAADRAVVVPIMMCDGQTVHRDIPHAFADIDPARLTFCPPVGTHPGLAALITKRASVAAHRMGTLPENAVLLLIALLVATTYWTTWARAAGGYASFNATRKLVADRIKSGGSLEAEITPTPAVAPRDKERGR